MILPFLALAAFLIFLVLFFVFAGKKKKQGKDLGENQQPAGGATSQRQT